MKMKRELGLREVVATVVTAVVGGGHAWFLTSFNLGWYW